MSNQPAPDRSSYGSLTEEQLVELMVCELQGYQGSAVEFAVTPLNAMQIAGLLQLVLRHPHIEPRTRQTAATLIAHIRWFFRLSPALSETFRRGYVQPDSITCPHCGMTSRNANDIAHRYCGACHKFAEDEAIASPRN